jgi:hypothetical protein
VGKLGEKTGVKLPLRSAARHSIYSYSEMVASMERKAEANYYRIPCVTPSWDNSARRREFARIFYGATPAKYQSWLKNVIQKEQANSQGKGLVFINAWNEWAEGNHLEPCQKWGRSYLEATRSALHEATIEAKPK